MNASKFLAAALLAAVGANAHAQALSARAGTNGLGAEVGVGFAPMLGLRAQLASGSYERDEVQSNINYAGKLKLSNGALLLDLHPFTGAFRLSTGLVYNNNQLDATGRGDSGSIEINGISYPASSVGTLQATVRWDKASPYLGFGWGTRPQGSGGIFLSADLGAFYQKPTASLTGQCGPSLPTFACDQLQSDIRAEERQFQDEVNKYKLYPVLNVGVGYRF